jgi:hypothetical protein
MNDNRKRSSPLKKPPLRQAGQSLQAERDKVWESIEESIVFVPILVVLTALEWWRYFSDTPPKPIPYTVVALIVIAFAWWRVRPRINLMRQINQGIQGEIHVGHCLDTLREKGFKVLHDIPGEGWNIDHVLIGTKGIFVVETKSPSKRHSKATIQYDGTKVLVNGLSPDRDPLIQAKAAAKWLQDFIERRANRKVSVRPVVIYPNWYVEGSSFGNDVWVQNDQTFLKVMDTEREKISADDVAHITDLLAEYARGDWS